MDHSRSRRIKWRSFVRTERSALHRGRLSSPDNAMSRFGNIATKCISADNGDILGGGFFNLKGFYEPQQYSIVLRRCDEGYELTNALLRMYDERAEIEQRYTEDLRSWVHRWKSYLDKSNEYGTNKAAWYAVVNSSDKDAEMHTNMRYRLFNDVINKVEQFKKEKYSRSLTARVKKSKEFEREFEASQKPWLKLLAKIENTKREYHASVRKLAHGQNVERTVHTDVGSTEEQRKKITEKVDICRKEMEFARDRYKQNLRDADDYKERYINAMNCVFEKCQLFERSRLDFFRESFESYVDVIMQVKEADVKKSGVIAKEGIQLHNSTKDLEWWSCTYGLGTSNLTKWPQFEEYRDRCIGVFSSDRNFIVQDSKPLYESNTSTYGKPFIARETPSLITSHQFSIASSCDGTHTSSLPEESDEKVNCDEDIETKKKPNKNQKDKRQKNN